MLVGLFIMMMGSNVILLVGIVIIMMGSYYVSGYSYNDNGHLLCWRYSYNDNDHEQLLF